MAKLPQEQCSLRATEEIGDFSLSPVSLGPGAPRLAPFETWDPQHGIQPRRGDITQPRASALDKLKTRLRPWVIVILRFCKSIQNRFRLSEA